LSETEHQPPVYGLSCTACGSTLELPVDLTAVSINCPNCGTDNVLNPTLIQARQRQFDQWLLLSERAKQVEQQRLMQQRMLAFRRAATRRNTVIVLWVVGIFLVLPAVVMVGLFALGIAFGNKAIHSMKEAQDPKRNGMPAIASEIRKKQAEGCQRVVIDPTVHFGSGATLRLPPQTSQTCVHLLGATSIAAANLTLEQSSQFPLATKLPEPAATFDYRLCTEGTQNYEFRVRSDGDAPFTIAAVACPRTVAEGLVRSVAGDPLTTSVGALREWLDELRAGGCRNVVAEPAAFQGPQVVDVDSTKGGPCFNLLVASHFADVRLTVKLTSPTGKPMVSPAPATRVRLEYCPSETGRHQVEIVPSTKDHFAMGTLDCPRRAGSRSPAPSLQSGANR
jgi:predicted RNA-binding Zn-ribbon protein involved in translation (DUF1610 family)